MTNPSSIPFSGHNKLSALLVGSHFSLADHAADRLAGLFDFTVPEGYEDETGFHLGPVRASDGCPPVESPVCLGEYI